MDGNMDAFVVNNERFNELLFGDGTGVFSSSLLESSGFGRGAVSGDYNGDSMPDILVLNENQANILMLNDGAGGFQSSFMRGIYSLVR
eukprot:SAG31_NODE_250_length_19098_cov_4.337123_6_plen_88_part_00